MYSTVKIDYGSNWQFEGVLICKWSSPTNPSDIEGHVHIEKRGDIELHSTMWSHINNLLVVEAFNSNRGLTSNQKAKLDIVMSLIKESFLRQL